MTWVIAISMSSTAAAKLYDGLPSCLMMMKSSMWSGGKEIGPKTPSVKEISSLRDLIRTTWLFPIASFLLMSSGERAAQAPE